MFVSLTTYTSLAKFDLANKTFADAQDHPRGRYDETHFWDKNGKLCGEIIGDVVWSYQDGDKEKVGHLDKNMVCRVISSIALSLILTLGIGSE